MRRTFLAVAMTAGLVLAMAAPASATIHEIVGSFCASSHHVPSPTGNIHNPPGLSGISSADNVAQPLLSSGVFVPHQATDSETFLVFDGFDSNGDPIIKVESGPATLLQLDEEHPAVKFEPLLIGPNDDPVYFLEPGTTATYVQIAIPDSEFAAFENCANFEEVEL